MYIEVNIAWKSFMNSSDTKQWKEKSKIINKRVAGIIWKAKLCYICKEKIENQYLKDKIFCKVREHCLYTGEYRGAVHIKCTLKYSYLKISL